MVSLIRKEHLVMKYRKLIILISLIFVVDCFFSSCSDPQINHTVIEDLDGYLRVNNFVEDSLQKDFKGILPKREQIKSPNAKYYYEYECGLDLPSYTIYLCDTHSNLDSFSEEIKRIENLSFLQVPLNQHETLFLFDPTIYHSAYNYMDDEIYDGLWEFFETVIVNTQTITIEYLTAYHQDNREKSEIIDYFAQAILENLNMFDYYSQNENYSELVGKIRGLQYYEKNDTLIIEVEVESSSKNDECLYKTPIGYVEFKLVYWSTYGFNLEINDTITFTSAPMNFYYLYTLPIVRIEKDGIEYLSFNEGKDIWLRWIEEENKIYRK